jgi:hypothetical protein
MKCFIIPFTALTLLLGQAASAAIVSSFDSSDEGWRPGDPDGLNSSAGNVTHSATGGNPGGFIEIEDLLTGSETSLRAYAPAKFLGDLRAFDGGTFSFDGKLVSGTWNPGTFGRLEIGSATTSAMQPPDPQPHPISSWQSYSVPMTAEGFGLTQGDWTALLSNVTYLRINLEDASGLETTALDNVVLVPEPTTFLLLSLATAGLILQGRKRMTS